MTLRHALKEWAVICQALALGHQSILLRKGGIADSASTFEKGHQRFWLYPTYAHQHQTGIKADAFGLLSAVEAGRPATGRIRLSCFAQAAGIYQVRDLFAVRLLDHLHIWSDEAVQARFAYRSPGVDVISVRVYRIDEPIELEEKADFAGCRSWVDLGIDLPTGGGTPVLGDGEFRHLRETLDRVLKPIALA